MNYIPILDFSEQTEDWCHGFEAGTLWARLSLAVSPDSDLTFDDLIGQSLHAENGPVLMQMAEQLGVAITYEEHPGDPPDGPWVNIAAIHQGEGE